MLVMKLTAVLNETFCGTADMSVGLNGSTPCSRSSR